MKTGSQLSKNSFDNRHCACNRTALILYHKLANLKEKGLSCDAVRRTKVGRG